MRIGMIAPLLVIVFSGCVSVRHSDHSVEYLTTAQLKESGMPFSEAVRVGRTLYLSGQLGAAPDGSGLVPGGIEAETRQTIENIQATLQRYGAELDDVVKCTVFLAEIGEWSTMNRVYVQYFSPPYPARSAVGGSGLAMGARVEIECIAVIR